MISKSFILDNNFVEDNINIKLGRISREIANSDQSSLISTEFIIPFHKNAKPASIVLKNKDLHEDFGDVAISELLEVIPNKESDRLTYQIRDLNHNLILLNANGKGLIKNNAVFEINDLNNVLIEAKENISGNFL